MQALFSVTAGLDVHRNMVMVSIARRDAQDADGRVRFETREFRAFRSKLREMAQWLKDSGVGLAIMESTGIYWRTVYEVLEDAGVCSIVVNAQHVKKVPGRKTDVLDAQWLAELGMHGLLKASFIPTRDIRELRILTRYRTRLVGMRASEKNRLHKVLDDCGIRLGSVVKDIDGVSARRMIDALLEGCSEPKKLVALAHHSIRRRKLDDLTLSLEGRISDRHRFVLRQIREHIQRIDEAIKGIDAQVVMAMEPYKTEWQLVQTIPGFDQISAAMLLAEIGPDMDKFKSSEHLSSWAGVCPGNNESAGKKSPHAPPKGTHI